MELSKIFKLRTFQGFSMIFQFSRTFIEASANHVLQLFCTPLLTFESAD